MSLDTLLLQAFLIPVPSCYKYSFHILAAHLECKGECCIKPVSVGSVSWRTSGHKYGFHDDAHSHPDYEC